MDFFESLDFGDELFDEPGEDLFDHSDSDFSDFWSTESHRRMYMILMNPLWIRPFKIPLEETR